MDDDFDPTDDILNDDDLMDSMNDMDDLDAQLFGKGKSSSKAVTSQKSTPNTKKKVSFTGQKSPEINLDDPLDGLLSSEDEDDDNAFDYKPSFTSKPAPNNTQQQKDSKNSSTPTVKKPVNNSKPKGGGIDDDLFDDDDDDFAGMLGFDDSPPRQQANKPAKLEATKVLDDLLGKKTVKSRPNSGNATKSLRFDKDGNFLKGKDELEVAAQDTSFGSYQPSSVGGGRRRDSASSRRPSTASGDNNPRPAGGGDDFFDFLMNESEPATRPTPTKTTGRRDTRPASAPKPSIIQPAANNQLDSLGLGKEIDIGAILSEDKSVRPASSGSQKQRSNVAMDGENQLRRRPTDLLTAKPDSSTTPTNGTRPPGRRSTNQQSSSVASSPVVEKPPQPIPTNSGNLGVGGNNMKRKSNLLTTTTQQQPSIQNESDFIDGLLAAAPAPSQRDFSQPQPHQHKIPTPMTNLADEVIPTPLIRGSAPYQQQGRVIGDDELRSEAKIRALEGQISHMKALLHEAELGYHADSQLTAQAHDGRVELLQRSLADIRSRSQREIENIRESYAMRLEAVREQSKDYMKQASERESLDDNEITRMRQLHMDAMKDLREDSERQISMLKKSHKDDMEALTSYGQYARNMDTMMEKVEKTTEKMQEFADKYDQVFDKLKQQSEITISSNQQFVTVVQEQLKQMERTSKEGISSLQESVVRFDSRIVEMNRKFDEHLYILRCEQTRVTSAQTSLEEERKYLNEQVVIEREQARKAQNEAVELQHRQKRELQIERDRQLRKEEEIRESYRAQQQQLQAEMDRLLLREQELSRHNDVMTRERASVNRRSEKIETDEVAVVKKMEEADALLSSLKEREEEMKRKEARIAEEHMELERKKQLENERVAQSERALREAQAIKQQQDNRLRSLRDLSEDVASQRRKLAEERKLVVEEHMTRHHSRDIINPNRKLEFSSMATMNHDNLTPAVMGGGGGMAAKKLAWNVIESPREEIPEHDNMSLSNLQRTPVADANAVLWKHAAQQDRHFLESEEFYLEALKHTPYHHPTT